MTDRRVVITGLGAVTPLGNDLHETLAGLREGRSATASAAAIDGAGRQVAEVLGFSPRQHFRVPKALKLTDRATQFAVASAAMALADGRWTEGVSETERLGVVIGSSGSDIQVRDLAAAIGPDPDHRAVHDIPYFAERILGGLHPLWLLVNLPNMVSAHVAIQVCARGPNSTIMTDWVAGSQAIGEAFDWIRRGDVEAVLAGGSDSGLYPLACGSYEQGGLFDGDGADQPCAAGEGAAILLLEDRDAATRRGARILAEIKAYATATSPIDPQAASDGGAMTRTMRAAEQEAGWGQTGALQVVTAAVFSERFRRVEHAARVRALVGPERISTREFTSRLGHALAAAGAIDVALSVALAAAGDGCRRILCNAIGYSGQATSLAIEMATGENERTAA